MKTSQKMVNIIKRFEGFRSRPYLCAAGVPTIGYGSTRYADGKKVSLEDGIITEGEATELLLKTLEKFERGVREEVISKINQNQFDALVSFTYNLGVGAFKKSTLLKKVNVNPNDPSITDEFLKWVKAGGKALKGLQLRRKIEADYYFSKL